MKLHQVQLLPRVPIILKELYDADLLEEDVIFAWAEKVSLSRVSHGSSSCRNVAPSVSQLSNPPGF